VDVAATTQVALPVHNYAWHQAVAVPCGAAGHRFEGGMVKVARMLGAGPLGRGFRLSCQLDLDARAEAAAIAADLEGHAVKATTSAPTPAATTQLPLPSCPHHSPVTRNTCPL